MFRSSSKSSGTVISLPDQLEVFRSSFESVPDQLRKCSGAVTKVFRISYESVPEQLRKCSGAVSKCSGAVGKCSGAVIKSSGTVISLP